MKNSKLIKIGVIVAVLVIATFFVIGILIGSNHKDDNHVHSYSKSVMESSCVDLGYISYTCECGDNYVEYVEALGHDFDGAVALDDASCTKRVLYESKCHICGETYKYIESPSGHSYIEVSRNVETIIYECEVCHDRMTLGANESIEDYLGYDELFDVEPTFTFDILTDNDEAFILENLCIVDSFFVGSEYETQAYVNYILENTALGVWTVSLPKGYAYDTTYIVSLSNGITFKDYKGEELTFTVKTDPNHENKLAYNDEVVFLKSLENASAGYYPYEIARSGERLYLTIGKIDGISKGQVLCVGDVTSFDDINSDTECYYGLVEDFRESDDGKWVLTLVEPEFEDIFDELDVVYDGEIDFEKADINLEQLEEEIVEALCTDEEFVEFLSVVKVSSTNYLADRGFYSPELADAHIFWNSLQFNPKISFSGNTLYIEVSVNIELSVKNSLNQEIGKMSIPFSISMQSSFDFDASYKIIRILGLNFDNGNLQITQTDVFNFQFGVVFDIYGLDEIGGYVRNTKTGEAHLACCAEVTRAHSSSSFEIISAYEAQSASIKCSRCKPENGSNIGEDFKSYCIDTLYCSDWEKVAEDIRNITEIDHNDKIQIDKTLCQITYPVYGPITINIEFKIALGLNIDAIIDYSYSSKNTSVYGVRINGYFVDLYKYANKEFEQKEYSVLGSAEIRAGIKVGAYMSVVGLENWIKAGVSAEVGVYANISGVMDIENSIFGAYFETGIYLEIASYDKLLFWTNTNKHVSEKFHKVRYGIDQLYFAYETYYDQLYMYDNSYSIYDNNLLEVRYIDLETMKIGKSELSLSENDKYKVNISFVDGRYCEIKNGNIVLKSGAPYNFTDTIIITVESKNSWDKYKNGDAAYYLGTYEIELVFKIRHNHIPSDWIIDKQPTDIETGSKHTECTVCGEWISTVIIPKISITYSAGLEYTLNSDGQSYSVTGIGTCVDTEIVIPKVYNGLPVTSIGDKAFKECTSLTSVTIPNSVTSIGVNAFLKTSLTSIIIPDSVTYIGNCAFANCDFLTYIEIGNSVEIIDIGAFYGCRSLTSIVIPDSVQTIGGDAFGQCYALTNVIIGKSVVSIGGLAFSECNITYIEVDEKNEYYQSVNGNLYTKDMKTLIQYAVNKNDTSFKIPDTVTTIEDYAFCYGKSLTSIVIPDSVTSIGNYAFADCTALASINIPNSVATIGYSAFYNCDSLKTITVPNNVSEINKETFCSCSSLESITIPNSVTYISEEALGYCSVLKRIDFQGTKQEWNDITKHYKWNYKSGSYVVYCTDGTISK